LKRIFKIYYQLWLTCVLAHNSYAQIERIENLNFDSLLQNTTADTLKIDYAFQYARAIMNKDTLASMSAYHLGKQLLSKRPNYVFGQVSQLYTEMVKLRVASQFEQGLVYADSILVISNVNSNIRLDEIRQKILIDKGYMLNFLGKYDEAIKTYQRVIDLAKTYNNNRVISTALNNIAAIYGNREAFEDQVRMMKQALDYSYKKDSKGKVDFDVCAFFSLTTAGAYAQLEQFDSAKVYLQRAASEVFPEHNTDLSIYYYLTLGSYEAAQKKYDDSNQSYLKALKIAEKINNAVKKMQLQVSLANNFQLLKNYSESVRYYKMAIVYCEKSNNIDQLIELYEAIYSVYKTMGDRTNAYIYLDKYYSMKDSLNFEEDRSEFNELEKKYSSKMKDQELTYFKNLNEVNQLSLSQNKIIIGAMIGLFLFGVLLAYFFIRNQKLVAKKNIEIAQLRISEAESLSHMERSRAILETQEEERSRIAKDLHDEVGGTLAALKLKLQNNDLNVNNHSAVDIVDQLARNVRQISHNMMPDAIEKFGLKNALAGYMSKLNMQSDTVFKYQMEALEEIKFSESREVAIYRIVQEVLTNALKHAKAKVVYIQMYESDGELSISIEDDGKGFDREQLSEGIGMKNITSRVNFLSGTIEYQTQFGKGTSVQINIPII
jgi:two-component system, NarL family, sensor kinase